MARRRLPPGMRKVTLKSGAVRYEVTLDAGPDPVTGKRRQTRRRFDNEAEAKDAYAEIGNEVAKGTYVARSAVTVAQLVDDYTAGRHKLRATSLSKLEYDLAPLRERHGKRPAQALTKRHLDDLVKDLSAGGTITAKGNTRKPWSPVAVNKSIQAFNMVLEDALHQGLVARNVAANIDSLPVAHKGMATYTPAEVTKLFAAVANDRNRHAWHLALSGFRRGEIAGLRWADVDLKAKTISISNNRTRAGGKTSEGEPKSTASRRTLPIPAQLLLELKAARARQAKEKLELGPDYGSGEYVVSNEAGDAYAPSVLTAYWSAAAKDAGVRHIRLHDARHTAATTLHLQGVPVAVIAAWIGHTDSSFTMRVYAHSQDDALKGAADVLGKVQ